MLPSRLNPIPPRGFTMIEVLVSVLIMAVGLLGLAGLQATGLRANLNTYMRSQAALLAYDMADRMRANKAGVDAGNYDAIVTTPTDPGCSSDEKGVDVIACSAAQMAQYDAYRWRTDIAALLPGGVGTVTNPPAAGSCNATDSLISVAWSGSDFQSDRLSDTQSFDLCVNI